MSRFFALLFLVSFVAAHAEAQVVEPPPRVTKPPRVEQTTSTLEMASSLFGGYDRNTVPADAQRAPDVTFDPSAFRGWGSADLDYALTNPKLSFTAQGGGTANTNNNVTSTSQGTVFGAHGNIGVQSALGRSTSFSVSQTAARTPYYTQGLFGVAPPGGYSPDTNPINGIVDGYMLQLDSAASMDFAITRETGVSLRYSYGKSRHEGGFTSAMEYRNQSGSLSVRHQIDRVISMDGSYRVSQNDGDQAGIQYNGLTHGFSLGFGRSQPLSPTRTLEISGGGGADMVDMAGSRFWQPTYYFALATDIARSWSLSTNYSQTTSVLNSPLSAPDSYLNQALTFSVGGNLSRRLHLTLFTAATRGEVAADHSVTSTKGDYTGVNSGAQLRTRLTGGLSAVFGANYYQSDLSGAAQQFQVTSGKFRRTSVRLGITWDAPLLGSNRRRIPRTDR